MLLRERDFPKEILVGETIFKIKFVNAIGEDCLGVCIKDGREGEILIERGQTPEERLSTYIHEVIHAYELTFRFKLSHKLVYRFEKIITDYLWVNHITNRDYMGQQ